MSRRRRKKGKRPPPPKAEPPSATPREMARAKSEALRPGVVALVVALIGAGALLYFLGGPRFEARRLNVLLVTVDTLRADRLGAYGNDRVPTPHIDRLAEGGILFEQAFTSAPVTLPSHASLLTGAYPIAHGVRDNGGVPLGPQETTLAEILSSEGYRTGAFVGAFVLDSRFGLDQGFERYGDDLPASATERRGDAVVEEALAWMDSVGDERFFAWVHLFDPHVPYDPPEPFRSRFDDPYDGEVAYVDSLVGRLVDWLDDRALTEDTLVVLVADHGESLGEHGERTHGFFVYDATMRVPLILGTPYEAIAGRRVENVVRTIDVMPTVLELVGLGALSDGKSLVPLARGDEAPRAESAYGEATFPSHYGWAELRSLRDEAVLFVDAPRPELYDLASDPGQERNVAAGRQDDVLAYRDRLRVLERELSASAESATNARRATLDPEVVSRLGALGYTGSAMPSRDPDSPAPDPKDKIELFNQIREASSLAEAGRLEDACGLLETVLEADPEVVEARNMLAGYLARRGELEAAVTVYRQALERDPDYAPAVFGLASAYLDLGRTDDALTGFERMQALEPGNPKAGFMQARLLIDTGRFEEALEVLEAVRTADESDAGTRLTMTAESRIGLGELDRASAALESALEENPALASANHQLGVVRERRGDIDGAIAAYEKEIAIAPESYRAHFDLAKLLAQRGRVSETIEHLERAIEANPRFALGHLYLANLLLDRGELERAKALAERGIALGPEPAFTPLGHFILADVYQRLGRPQEAQREMATAQRLHEALNR